MSWPDPIPFRVRRERHFGDRIVTCFADRPPHLDATFREALAAAPEAEAHSRPSVLSACPDYKVPETFTVVPGPLPRNANGKLLKTELRAHLPDPVAPGAGRCSPAT